MEVCVNGKGMVDDLKNIYFTTRKFRTWKPPSSDLIKINIDGNFVEAITAMSVGVVARNHVGEVIISS